MNDGRMSAPRPELIVVVVACRRVALLARCLESVLAQRGVAFGVHVVLNGALPEVAAVAAGAAKDPRVTVSAIDAVTPAEARNVAVRHAQAELVYFLDDDAWLPDDGALARVVAAFRADPELAVLGGPNLTPPDDPEIAHLTGTLLGSWVATGPTAARYRPRRAGPASERELILCNLAARREALEAHELPAFFPGEENALLALLRSEGRRLAYDPDVFVYHHRRASLGAYLGHVQFYGRGRAYALLHTRRAFHALHAAPLALLVYLLLAPVLTWLEPLLAAPLLVYLVCCVFAASGIALRARRPGWLPTLVWLLPATHLAYAIGFVSGLAERARRRAALEVESVEPGR